MLRYTPKLLRVNLGTGASKEEVIPQKTAIDFVGGRGFGIKYLYQELPPRIDPLSSDNKLIFAIGPLAGTGALSFSRWLVTTKSPLTGTYFRSSAGADFGAWLRFAGLDLIILEGKAASPAYLYVEDGKYEMRDAGELWGKNTAETQEQLREIHGKGARIACIGPAGEKLVRYAAIVSDRRTASRGGVGAVMGSKNLKAIVIKAVREVKLPKPEEFKELISQQVVAFRGSGMFKGYSEMGTCGFIDYIIKRGLFPVRNFREGKWDGWEKLSPKEYADIKVKDTGCYACMINCGKIHKVKNGPYTGATSEGPEYESLWAFTGSIASSDVGATVVADALCDDLGMDTISTGNSIGFAYELFEKGLLSLKDTDGLDLSYGNHEAAIELIKRIGNRGEWLGDILAEGVRRAALRIGGGSEVYAMHIKGLEIPAYEPRAAKRHGLGLATSNIGANQNLGFCAQEVFGIPSPRPVDRFAEEGNTDIVKSIQDRTAMHETGVGCVFAWDMMPVRLLLNLLASATGIPEFSDRESMFRVGERIYNLERAFNLREGFSRTDDNFPLRLTTEPLKNAGPAEGQIIRRPAALLDEYYRFRGWDESGVPTPEKLKELTLEEITRDMRPSAESSSSSLEGRTR